MKSQITKKEPKPPKFTPRIVVKFDDLLTIPYNSSEEIEQYLLKNGIISLKELQEKYPGIKIDKLFTSVEPAGIKEAVKKAKERNKDYNPPNFFTYCVMDCSYETNTKELLETLLKNKNVEFAYIEDEPAPPPGVITGTNPGTVTQGYLDPAPAGIDARYAWNFVGGCGEGRVKFIDIEYAWKLDHEDISNAQVQFLWGKRDHTEHRGHGTSVLGVILMQDNMIGGLGIAREVKAQVVSQISPAGRNTIHDAIIHATSHLEFGDILLLEVQASTHDDNGTELNWPGEIQRAIFHVIELATNKGIIVIEAAGNGNSQVGSNLDEFANNSGKNILDINSSDFKESNAIMVGAASDSPAHGKSRSSNYGNRVNCFAWGSNVFTADDPDNPVAGELPYTDKFAQTSSASAIIAGAAIIVQSIAEASGKKRLGPGEMRNILSDPAHGTSSRNAIGVMPDLKKIIDNIIPGLPNA